MASILSYSNTIKNEKIEQAFSVELEAKYKKVEKEASRAIGSFATLVEELVKLKELSTGTQAKEEITKLTSELNNSSVFFAKMISEELNKLHGIVSPETPGLKTEQEV